MVIQTATLAGIRFGYGLRPDGPTETGPADMLDGVTRTVNGARGTAWSDRMELARQLRRTNEARRIGKPGAEAAYEAALAALRAQSTLDLKDLLGYPVGSPHGFSERLVTFWSDHFAISAGNLRLRLMTPDLIQTTIRPRIAGQFSDLLTAVTTHPAMMVYLNQVDSVGPNSPAGRRRDRGLNENLAREILELHSLGVDGRYGQNDVQGLANLLTGLSMDQAGFRFRTAIAEPGRQEILNRVYGAERPTLDHIREALHDVALHPDTARHLSRKLIVHFVGAPAPEDWIASMANAYLETDGHLPSLYRALLDDPRAWQMPFHKVKTPFEFVVSALRAAGASEANIRDLSGQELRRGVVGPLEAMGQPPLRPPGPDGWGEAPEIWITPPALATRIRWSQGLSDQFLKDRDPREFMRHALADAVSPTLEFAVNGAENRAEGIALVLASPEFNRR